MNKAEALAILGTELAVFREKYYTELVSMIDRKSNPCEECAAPSGALYYVEMQVFWDDEPGGDVRVMGSIDDGGWRALMPLSEDFIMDRRVRSWVNRGWCSSKRRRSEQADSGCLRL